VARDRGRLEEAKKSLQAGSRVKTVSADVGNYDDVVTNVFADGNHNFDIVICSAGVSHPARFLDAKLEYFDACMRVNYMGIVHCLKAALPAMVARKQGRVILVASLASLISVPGLTAYNASKFAVRGLGEALQMELSPHNVLLTVYNPPDVDTPMLQAELLVKSEECKIISGDGGVFTADRAAVDAVKALKQYRPFVFTGLDGWLAGQVCCTSPSCEESSFFNLIFQVMFAGVMRLVSLWYNFSWRRTVHRVIRGEEASGQVYSTTSTSGETEKEKDRLLRQRKMKTTEPVPGRTEWSSVE